MARFRPVVRLMKHVTNHAAKRRGYLHSEFLQLTHTSYLIMRSPIIKEEDIITIPL